MESTSSEPGTCEGTGVVKRTDVGTGVAFIDGVGSLLEFRNGICVKTFWQPDNETTIRLMDNTARKVYFLIMFSQAKPGWLAI